jgi:hypothetical protein
VFLPRRQVFAKKKKKKKKKKKDVDVFDVSMEFVSLLQFRTALGCLLRSEE